MANITYTYTLPNATQATRYKAYGRLSSLFSHLPHLANIDIVSLSRTGLNLSITLTNPLPDDQIGHLGCAVVED